MAAWQQLPPRYPPANWRAPPAAGFLDASGMRPVSSGPWQPVRLHSSSRAQQPGLQPVCCVSLQCKVVSTR